MKTVPTSHVRLRGPLKALAGADREATTTRFLAAARTDADAFRGLIEMVNCTALPQEVLARPAVARAVEAADDGPPQPFPGPDREQLLRLLAA